MPRYSAHYGTWNEPGGVHRVEFGKVGVFELYETENYRLAVEKAQEAANESGQIVHFCKTYVLGGGRGLAHEWKKVYPVRSKIKFVRMYKMYRENWYDVIYHSGRVCTYTEPELPATVEKFVESSAIREEQFDKVFNRNEMIYF